MIEIQNPSMDGMTICVQCSQIFQKNRRDQKYCRDACRKNAYQTKDRKENPKNSTESPDKRRRNEVLFDTAKRLAEELYGLPPCERLGYIKTVVDVARDGNAKLVRILTNKILLKPDRSKKRLFHRECPATYFTISEAADKYCRKFWDASVYDVVHRKAPEPETGEVFT